MVTLRDINRRYRQEHGTSGMGPDPQEELQSRFEGKDPWIEERTYHCSSGLSYEYYVDTKAEMNKKISDVREEVRRKGSSRWSNSKSTGEISVIPFIVPIS